jgi:hypothetical protein
MTTTPLSAWSPLLTAMLHGAALGGLIAAALADDESCQPTGGSDCKNGWMCIVHLDRRPT